MLLRRTSAKAASRPTGKARTFGRARHAGTTRHKYVKKEDGFGRSSAARKAIADNHSSYANPSTMPPKQNQAASFIEEAAGRRVSQHQASDNKKNGSAT
jgi:hypothetical protein